MCVIENNIPKGLRLRVAILAKARAKTELERRKLPKWLTIATLLDECGNEVARGVSSCSPDDNPCRRTGRAIAVGRAVHEYERLSRGVVGYFGTKNESVR